MKVLSSVLMICLATLPAALPAGAQAQPPAKTVLVEGFRSAKFGMTEAAALKTIKADFDLSGTAVLQQTNAAQGTHILKITVKNLLPGSGQAQVAYSFGYKSDKLDEIDVTWAAKDPGNSATALLQYGQVLQNYFLSESFAPGSVTGSALLSNGNLLLFRGKDSAGHAVGLFISGPATHDATSNKTNITPEMLTVAYIADPAHPDVFHIQPGSF